MFKFKIAGKSAVTRAGARDDKNNNANEQAETDARLNELESAIGAINNACKLLCQANADANDSPAERAATEQRDGAGSSRICSDEIPGQRWKSQRT